MFIIIYKSSLSLKCNIFVWGLNFQVMFYSNFKNQPRHTVNIYDSELTAPPPPFFLLYLLLMLKLNFHILFHLNSYLPDYYQC